MLEKLHLSETALNEKKSALDSIAHQLEESNETEKLQAERHEVSRLVFSSYKAILGIHAAHSWHHSVILLELYA